MNHGAATTDSRSMRIDVKHFELSPFFDFYATDDMVLGVYAGRFFAESPSADSIAEYESLRRDAVLYDTPERPLQIEGSDATPFLERVFSRPVADLRAGRGRYAIACTPHGGVYMDGILFRLDEEKFWYVQADGAMEPWFIAHSAGFHVEISDPQSWVIQIQGPKSLEIMNAATCGAIDERLRYFHAGFFDFGNQNLYVSRTGWTGELGYEIYTQACTDVAQLWAHITEAGCKRDMVVAIGTSMTTRRIEAGILDNGTDMDTTITPYQAGLAEFVDLDHKGFVGREALLEADRRSLTYGLRCQSLVLCAGQEIYDGNRVAGRLTAGAWSPTLDCGVGYARFHSPSDWLGRKLRVFDADGSADSAEVVELPFFDREKRIPRGLNLDQP